MNCAAGCGWGVDKAPHIHLFLLATILTHSVTRPRLALDETGKHEGRVCEMKARVNDTAMGVLLYGDALPN